jgi:transcription-repair coupling factor (superfamily II helicase)
VLAGALRSADRPILAIVAGEREAEELVEDIELFTDDVVHLPAWETLPFEHMSPNVVTMGRRVLARHKLAGTKPIVVVASVRAVTQRVSPTDTSPIHLDAGGSYDFEEIVERLADRGYSRVDRTESRGDFSVRGGIIDVYPPGVDTPLRLDFFGDSLEEIRTYDALSQRSDGYLDSVEVFPAREVLYDDRIAARAEELRIDAPWASDTWDRIAEGISFQGMESWLPWLAPPRTVLDESSALCYMFDPARCSDRALDLIKEEEDLAEALSGTWGDEGPRGGAHPPLYLPLDFDQLDDRMLEAPPHAAGPGDEVFKIATLDGIPGDPESIAAAVNRWRDRGVSIVVAMDGVAAANRVSSLLSESGADMPVVEVVEGTGAFITSVGIHAGFIIPDLGVGVVGEHEVAGRRRAHRKLGHGPRRGPVDAFRDLNDGDFVVHRHHGIGRFSGLVHRNIAGAERDYLLVEYAGDDKIYIPTDQLAAIARYSGGESPRLSRLGGTDWSQTRQKVRKEVAIVADQVVELQWINSRRSLTSKRTWSLQGPWIA